MRRIAQMGLAAVVSAALSAPVLAAEGSCAHDQMRLWVDTEEICYHRWGPLGEEWRTDNQSALDSLEGCLRSARSDYRRARLACELRGESAYRADNIHRNWDRYRPHYDSLANRLREGR